MPTVNVFVSVNAPGGIGTGTPVDVSGMGTSKTLTLPSFGNGTIVLEASGDSGASFAPFLSLNGPSGELQTSVVIDCAQIRVKRVAGSGPEISIGIAGVSNNNNHQFTLLPIGDPIELPGPDIFTSEYPEEKTLIVTGDFVGEVVISGSADGFSFNPVPDLVINGPGVYRVRGTYEIMHVERVAYQSGAVNSISLCTTDMVVWIAMSAAISAQESAAGALAQSILTYSAFTVFQNMIGLPPGVKTVEFPFNEGTPLSSEARFLVAQFFQSQFWDNIGHTGIRCSIGVHGDVQKYASLVDVTNPVNDGKTFTSVGDGGLFQLAPIGGDAPVVYFESDDDLNTIIQGRMGTKLFYSTP